MVKRSLRFIMSATLLVASGSFARADNYSISSNWHIGSASPDAYTGNGTFTWNGSSFSNVVFTFTDTEADDAGNTWTAAPTDGELLSSNKELIIGNSGTDCAVSCVGITFSSAVTTGSAQTLTVSGSANGFSQTPNSIFDNATLTDTSFGGGVPEPSAIILLATVTGILGVNAIRRRKRLQIG